MNFRVVLPEVFKPPIQLSQNVIQAFDEMFPVMPHPESTEVLSDRDLYLVETRRTKPVPLRPNEEEVRLEDFDVSKSPYEADDARIRSPESSQAKGWK